jgi:RHS repeat-associated protein
MSYLNTNFRYTRAYSGEYSELLYLRARFYAPDMGRFLTRDTWNGDYQAPLTLNRWNYTSSNPINYDEDEEKLEEKCERYRQEYEATVREINFRINLVRNYQVALCQRMIQKIGKP